MVKHFTIFEYLYRDASNYKVHNSLLLSGRLSPGDEEKLMESLEDKMYFVAEQVRVPPLYNELWDLSDGPTEDDLPTHEFEALRPATQEEIETMRCAGTLKKFISMFQAVKHWDHSLSANYEI